MLCLPHAGLYLGVTRLSTRVTKDMSLCYSTVFTELSSFC